MQPIHQEVFEHCCITIVEQEHPTEQDAYRYSATLEMNRSEDGPAMTLAYEEMLALFRCLDVALHLIDHDLAPAGTAEGYQQFCRDDEWRHRASDHPSPPSSPCPPVPLRSADKGDGRAEDAVGRGDAVVT